ncbi:serine aminopeptidase domain-containing protein [Chitinophaga sp. Cy-1792]|uniref:serine aminopeptidase domain-containing protein n=1 Tax=Chitinophaga sp. Cy-1792 TaxID=2608339 RepID=UPI00141E328F|nr:alpha/beta hydrolase [Chitinophaga sp. Cy-1792]NIG54400.1 DUF3887 domain-containing protein [Chitinophaga sp. Cy-1792]
MRLLKILVLILFTTNVYAQTKDIAVDFCNQLSRENWTAAYNMMDSRAMAGVNSEVLRTAWNKITQQYGKWEQLGEIREMGRQGLFEQVQVTNIFERNSLVMNIVVTPERKITGFTIAKVLSKVLLRAGEVIDTVQAIDGTVLYGTLQQPAAAAKGPVVLIIAGSGPVDRNGDVGLMEAAFQHSYMQLADGLAANGIASLRFDKRAIGESAATKKSLTQLSLDDYVSDAADWVRYLRNSGKYSSVIIAGHSEGSLIGMAVAALQPYDAFISISGAGEPLTEVVTAQVSKLISPESALKAKGIFAELKYGQTPATVSPELQSILNPATYAYWRSSFHYVPCELIGHLTMPVLIINGTKDTQVPPEQATYLHDCLPGSKLLLIKDMVHPLKDAAMIGVNQKEALPLHVDLIPAMVAFIRQQP